MFCCLCQVGNKRDRSELVAKTSRDWSWDDYKNPKKAKYDKHDKENQRQVSSVKCFKCGSYGHYAAACPSKKK